MYLLALSHTHTYAYLHWQQTPSILNVPTRQLSQFDLTHPHQFPLNGNLNLTKTFDNNISRKLNIQTLRTTKTMKTPDTYLDLSMVKEATLSMVWNDPDFRIDSSVSETGHLGPILQNFFPATQT